MKMEGTVNLEDTMKTLRKRYALGLAVKALALEQTVSALRAGDDTALTTSRTVIHRIAGAAGCYGFPALSGAALELDLLLRDQPDRQDIPGLVGRLITLLREAATMHANTTEEPGEPAHHG